MLITILSNLAPESPRYLYEKEKFEEAKMVVNKMARMNKSSKLIPGSWVFDKEPHIEISPERINYSQYSSDILANKSVEIDGFDQKEAKESIAEMNVIDKESPFKLMKADPVLVINLLIIMASWISTSFNNYLLSFNIRNFGGDLYINAWAFGLSGILGKIIAGFLRKYFSTKLSLLIMLVIVCMFGFGLIFFKNAYIVALCIGMIELGIGGSFTLVYFVTTEYFPPLFTAFAFAVCQVGARFTTIASYVLSDLKSPIPMILLCSTGVISLITLVFLSKPRTLDNTSLISSKNENSKKYIKFVDDNDDE